MINRKKNVSSINDQYYTQSSTGYKIFDESLFGKSPLERLKKQPDYRANIIWPLYQYFRASNYTAMRSEFQKLLEAYDGGECIDGTSCLYNLQDYMQIYKFLDFDKKDLIIVVDRTHGFIPACLYSKPSRFIDGKPNKFRSKAFYQCMESIKENFEKLMEAINVNKDDWYALQKQLPKILNYGT